MQGLIQESLDFERGGTQKSVYAADEVMAVPCPLCGSERHERLCVEHGTVGVVQCLDCALMYTSPRLKAPEKLYWGDETKFLAEGRLIFKGRAPHHRDVNYKEELALIRRYKPTGRFLDVGCNMGFLLRRVRQMGWEAVGVEPSPSLAKLAREQWQLPIHNCFIDEMPLQEAGTFDIVALSDVFEHIATPLPFLNDVQRMMKDDAIVYVKVPNARFSLFKQRVLRGMGREFASGVWDSDEHVVHYTDDTIRSMLDKAGFDVVEVTFAKPVNAPVWHEYVGHYYLNPTPWYLDWKRVVGRTTFYYASFPERVLRGGKVGVLAQNLVVIARKRRS